MIVVETIVHRWYAFAFLAAFFWSARGERTWTQTLRFAVVAFVVSFAAELSSTRNGFPYGGYTYIAPGRADELYLSNVPAFVPLTFGVVVWAGRSVARWAGARSPLERVLGGTVAAAAIDLVIDPVTVRGGEWFLGPLYAFDVSRGWFGVPWTNLAGWLLVSALILAIDESVARASASRDADPPPDAPHRGVLLAAAVCAFFVVLAFATGHPDIGAATGGVSVALFGIGRASRALRGAP